MSTYELSDGNEHHMYRTPPGLSEIECWRLLGDYLGKHVDRHVVFFRDTPQVIGDFDFDTWTTKYVGLMRFIVLNTWKNNEKQPDQPRTSNDGVRPALGDPDGGQSG